MELIVKETPGYDNSEMEVLAKENPGVHSFWNGGDSKRQPEDATDFKKKFI